MCMSRWNELERSWIVEWVKMWKKERNFLGMIAWQLSNGRRPGASWQKWSGRRFGCRKPYPNTPCNLWSSSLRHRHATRQSGGKKFNPNPNSRIWMDCKSYSVYSSKMTKIEIADLSVQRQWIDKILTESYSELENTSNEPPPRFFPWTFRECQVWQQKKKSTT